ncbi:hypothetical protein SYNPS1DRAFT_23084 [Syncephalis pseudoplumigaleata]|uniref:Uncharacterized protein n=1 Tax=Syncephalis pseudoplumigaleata TaxID=1712513 RepID=A0A4P9YY82_9FUNG|nr:hypothetical protein SYNPS1DRAFT_23084 [Syncephalis pseudoplumigaleata]|eukprot:RKP24875.1 hypothetical protein SYNPS1DRAFT_23084 [Syncephalis pseudoplumigaleata]
MWTGAAVISAITVVVAALTGQFRQDGRYVEEVAMMQLFLACYALFLLCLVVVVWRFGIKIQRLVHQRATIAEQFNSQALSGPLGNAATLASPCTSEEAAPKSDASLYSSAERMYIVNQSFLWMSLLIAMTLIVYAVAVRNIYQNAILVVIVSFIVNVGGLAIVVAIEKLAKSTFASTSCSIELPALDYPNWPAEHTHYIADGTLGRHAEPGVAPASAAAPLSTAQMMPRPAHVTFTNRTDALP